MFATALLRCQAVGTAVGALAGAANGRSGGKFMGSSSLFWSTGVITVLGSARCSVNQFINALLFNVCKVDVSTTRDGSTIMSWTIRKVPFSLMMGLSSPIVRAGLKSHISTFDAV